MSEETTKPAWVSANPVEAAELIDHLRAKAEYLERALNLSLEIAARERSGGPLVGRPAERRA